MTDLTNAAVVAVHLQNDIVHADGAFSGYFAASAAERGVVAKAGRILNAARDNGRPVIYTRVGWPTGHATLLANTPLLQIVQQTSCLTLDTWQTEILAEVPPQEGDIVITNDRVSGFANSSLDTVLRSRGIDTIVVFGVATNASVESTIREGSDLGYNVILVEDASSTVDEAVHAATTGSLGLFAEILTTDELLGRLG
ncbi:MAG: cysteine hydrolase [Microbacterium sp.]|mgnify:CR=1 FL=1|nr:cysteine hydrolase [Microbacterium sp.]|tara:strand:- start:254 stop:847 length:594 start_codon:yes stop_codon:yes gene_type:complete